ncbi:hypothetical protein CONCODRAFT_19422 [Conidiobolus coronatus NRRL 28638]|uniref:F-box domain-containing protein n=1 Tax=Conidiobolus coronatus (strain ATCC 28846 / CBS 209.66 / NRRL 28638) TaxID=796925 RepID=A0A137NYH9_CONC2|nr:hypothetical protein CONCODRAFT_19422 [Conidiobolus coronatus NRRL 28638]|eukprot:KXN67721.1 hypothetical protein CONCODRAFT_19422 [Conidiobolus coronatus NRRL 28638]
MNSDSTNDNYNINSIIGIDWEFILINNPIFKYLSKYELLDLSLTSKRLRSKISPRLFNTLRINNKVLYSQPNFFQHKNNFELDRLTYWEKIRLLSTHSFDKNILFKETQIDPFINQSAATLRKVANYCKVLNLYELKNSSYFLIPIATEFLNLTQFYIYNCELPLYRFNVILTKLVKLEILHLDIVQFLKSSEDSDLANDVNFPQSLKALNYERILLVITDSPQLNTIDFTYNLIPVSNSTLLGLPVKHLPKLELLSYGKRDNSQSLTKFLEINPQLKSLCLTIALLTPASLSTITSMPNLERLKIETNGTYFEEFNIPSSPNLEQLKDLFLYITTESDFNLINQFIKFTPNLTQLTIRTKANEQFEIFDKLVDSLKYFTKSTETRAKFNSITKIYYK